MRGVLAAALMFVCALVVTATQAGAREQDAAQPAAPQNLQVLPKEMTRAEVTALMRTFTAALGVQCTHCHIGSPQERFKDDLPAKATARKMLKMAMAINADHMGVKTGEPTKVTCFTCHRGALKPLTAAPAGGN